MKRKQPFDFDETVCLKSDRTEWIVTHAILDKYSRVTWRISNGYGSLEVDACEIEKKQEPMVIKGFRNGTT